ncbi:MAG: phosphate ABC transporter substrate-binding protein [Polyangiaceae bacterium]|jgi:phosphate transport system substrate-binding protein
MRTVSLSLVILASLALAACDKTPPPQDNSPSSTSSSTSAQAPAPKVQSVTVSGSSALQPLVNAAKEKYETTHAGASIEVSAGGSKKGISDVASGAVQIGDSDIPAPDDLKGQLVDHKVAVVGFAAMANKGDFNAKVTSIPMKDLARIFTGEVKNWKEVGGGNQAIVVINRAPASGTRAVFGGIVLGGDKFIEGQTEDNSGALVAKLKQTKGAISYLALSFKDDDLLTLSLKGADGAAVDSTDANIESGTYPIWSYEHMFTKGEATGQAKAFLDYVLSPDFQKTVLPSVKGFIPVTSMKVTKD